MSLGASNSKDLKWRTTIGYGLREANISINNAYIIYEL